MLFSQIKATYGTPAPSVVITAQLESAMGIEPCSVSTKTAGSEIDHTAMSQSDGKLWRCPANHMQSMGLVRALGKSSVWLSLLHQGLSFLHTVGMDISIPCPNQGVLLKPCMNCRSR